MSIKKIYLKNFKCFKEHTIYFRDLSIMIGKNNAGKSTIIEALRILSLSCYRLKNVRSYKNRPTWLQDILKLSVKGILVSSKVLDIDFNALFYRYDDPPAIIKLYLDNNVRIESYINEDNEIFVCTFFKIVISQT